MKGKTGGGPGTSKSLYKDKEKPTQIRYSNITAAKGLLFTLVTLAVHNCYLLIKVRHFVYRPPDKSVYRILLYIHYILGHGLYIS